MPELPNPKHERFARYVTEGMDVGEAFMKSGYSENKASARILLRRPHIRERIAELENETQQNLDTEEEEIDEMSEGLDDLSDIQAVTVTRAFLLKHLADNIVKAKRMGQFSASNKAIEMMGDYLGGMFNRAAISKGGRNQSNPDVPVPVMDGEKAFKNLLDFAKVFNDSEARESMEDRSNRAEDVTPKKRGRPPKKKPVEDDSDYPDDE